MMIHSLVIHLKKKTTYNFFSDDNSDNSLIESKIDMELAETFPVNDIVDKLPQKQKFSNLDNVRNLGNYVELPQKKICLFEYQNASKTLSMQRKTQKQQKRKNSG